MSRKIVQLFFFYLKINKFCYKKTKSKVRLVSRKIFLIILHQGPTSSGIITYCDSSDISSS